jgi:hypothetical protein
MPSCNTKNTREGQPARFPSVQREAWALLRLVRTADRRGAGQDAHAQVSKSFDPGNLLFATQFLSQLRRLQDAGPVSSICNKFEEVSAR